MLTSASASIKSPSREATALFAEAALAEVTIADIKLDFSHENFIVISNLPY